MPDGLKLYRRLRFYGGNCFRLITSPWQQHIIAPDLAVTIFAATFGNDGWHHLKSTLKEYDEDNNVDMQKTSLWCFLKNFCPTSISLLADPAYKGEVLPMFVQPWDSLGRYKAYVNKDVKQSRFCGPSSDDFIAQEYKQSLNLYKVLKSGGYRPWQYGHTFIGGTMLEANSGEQRFLVLQGNHRMAILAHLGFERVPVRSLKDCAGVVYESGVESWPLVRAGHCTVEHALSIYNFYFHNNGHHIRRNIFVDS